MTPKWFLHSEIGSPESRQQRRSIEAVLVEHSERRYARVCGVASWGSGIESIKATVYCMNVRGKVDCERNETH